MSADTFTLASHWLSYVQRACVYVVPGILPLASVVRRGTAERAWLSIVREPCISDKMNNTDRTTVTDY